MSSSELEIVTDRSRVDVALVHRFLLTTNWAAGRNLDAVKRTIDNSVCFSGFVQGQQVAFGRLITDQAVHAYVADVFVLPEWRGRGFGKALTAAMVGYADRVGIVHVTLHTKDAAGLYGKFGFSPINFPREMLRRSRPGSQHRA